MPDRANSRRSTASDESNPYWISFADIMAAILVVFILAVVMLVLQLQQRQKSINSAIKELADREELRAEILKGIKSDLAKLGIEVIVNPDSTVLTIPDKLLSFRTNRFQIPKKSESDVTEIGRIIYEQITKEDRTKKIDTIFVEGHTDSVPAPSFQLGNWGLSSSRAISVWQFWVDEQIGSVPELATLKNGRGENLFSVSGYSYTRRVELNDETESLRRKNRRIDIRFSMRAPTVKEFDRVKGLFD